MNYDKLPYLDRSLAETGAKPKGAAYLATAVTAFVGWLWLIFLTSGASQYGPVSSLGPGMDVFRPLLDLVGGLATRSTVVEAFLRLCSPQISDASGFVSFLSIFAMWVAMCIAMMLPSAAPMLRTYGDIAQTAQEKGEITVPLYVLASGYLATWILFSVAVALLQMLFIEIGVLNDPSGTIHGVVGGGLLIVAGLYQFRSLKDACLEKCRNPFTTLFSQWSTKVSGVFRLGLEQGVFCIGCCWALMLVMFVVGTMNLAWMAFFTLFTIVEKSNSGKVTSRVTGVILLLWGGILLSISTANL